MMGQEVSHLLENLVNALKNITDPIKIITFIVFLWLLCSLPTLLFPMHLSLDNNSEYSI